MHRELGLFSISVLEKGRVTEQRTDAKDIVRFVELEALIAGSLTQWAPTQKNDTVRAKSPALSHSGDSLGQKGTFRDQSVLQKLLQYRDRIPLSSRIIRAGQS
jgi:hypothetical protein